MVENVNELKLLNPMTDKQVIGSLLQERDIGQEYVEGNNNYVWFRAIGNFYRPKVIAEMGTRFGYSLKSFVDGAGHPPEEYSLWIYDIECDGFPTLHIMEDYFRTMIGIQDIHVHKVNTQAVKSLGVDRPVDLAIVDGEHTVDGCFHECSLAWDALKPGGIIVVDDVVYDAPRNGALKFCAAHKVMPIEYLPSLRGIYLIQKP